MRPVRTLSSRTVSSSGRQDSFDNRFGNWTESSGDITPRNPNLPVPPPETGRPLGIFTGEPMPAIFGFPNRSGASGNGNGNGDWLFSLLAGPGTGKKSRASAFDAGTPPVSYLSPGNSLSADRQNSFGDGNGAASPAANSGGALSSPMPQPLESQGPASPVLRYLENLKQRGGYNPQASVPEAGAAPLVPFNGANPMCGLPGRIAALTGVDPENPDQLAPPPQDGDLRGFYHDDPTQPWLLRALIGGRR